MITTYHRPKTMDEALALLNQSNTLPLGGGTLLASRHPTSFNTAQGKPDSVSIVDLHPPGWIRSAPFASTVGP